MHKHLERQLRRAGGRAHLDIDRLLSDVDAYYQSIDAEQKLNHHANQLMSEELLNANAKIRIQSEAKLQTILQNTSEAILSIRESGIIDSVNRAGCRLFRKSEEAMVGNHIDQYILFPDFDNLVGSLREGQKLFFSALKGQRDRNDFFSLEVSIDCTVYDDHFLLVLSVRDLTDYLLAEQEREIYTEQLSRSNAELERFAYIASHDLQEPLRNITSFISLLNRRLKDRLDDEEKEYLQFINDGSKRMSDLIRGLLNHSRLQNKTSLSKVNHNILLQEVCRDMGALLKDAEIQISTLPSVLGDTNQLHRLWLNLISNAIKFRKLDHPCQIKIDSKILNEQWIQFSITDNGIGIAEENQEIIFDIFKRLHSRDEYEGSGLGLSICRKIVQNHRGKIWAESVLGKGSTFYFWLPAAE
jgi:PAS domain S-box-containing protein